MRARFVPVSLVLLACSSLAARSLAAPPTAKPASKPDAAATAEEDPRREAAKAHFMRGVEHSDRGEWDAALAEFLESRAILPTSKNTYNAAVVLRKVNRFDEALDMYEALLRDFPDLTPSEKQVAERELAQLKNSVGAVEIRSRVTGAKILIDGRERGSLPSPPLRVSAGSHTVRITADGYLPFEKRIDVAGTQTVTIQPELAVLTAAGRLHVAEQTGRSLDVVVDNTVVGKTPWEGALAPGEHTVLLRGEGNTGTQPVRPNVSLNQVVTLNLLAEELGSSVRIEAVPATSTLSIDGIVLGRGGWTGRLRPGTHEIAATAEGFLPFRRSVVLDKDGSSVVRAHLERDPHSALFAAPRPNIAAEIDAALPLGAVFGGDVTDACSGGCSSSLPLGLHTVLHGVYQTGSGFGGGVDAGYLLAFQSVSGRDAPLEPKGRPPNPGVADDALRLSGLTLGASAQYHRAGDWPLTFRLGAGVLLGSVRDARSGSFTSSTGERYDARAETSAAATYLYVAPEIRVGRAIAKHFEINAGAEVLLMTALVQPRWRDGTSVLTANAGRGDGLATFGEQTTLASFLVLVAPGIGARYDF